MVRPVTGNDAQSDDLTESEGSQQRSGIRNVLVATDFSEHADAALARAFAFAVRHGAEVAVLHVVAPRVRADLVEVAEASLRELVRDAPVPVETEVASGAVDVEVARVAEDRSADIVVVGAHGADWLRDLFVGATANAVVEVTPVPVLIARIPATEAYSTVLLAVDNSVRMLQAVRVGLALIPGANHILVHVVAILGENLLRLNGAQEHEIAQLRRGQVADVRAEIDRLAGELVPQPAEVLVEPGRPEKLLPELAAQRGAGLVVLGVDRKARLRRAVLGSVSRHVMLQAPCDVLVVPLL